MELLPQWRILVWDLACGGMGTMMSNRPLRRWCSLGGNLVGVGGKFQKFVGSDGLRDIIGSTDGFLRDL